MRKSTLLLAAGVGLLAITNLWLLAQLRNERTRSAGLRTEIAAAREAGTSPRATQRVKSPSPSAQVRAKESAVTQAPSTDDREARIEAARKRHERFESTQRRLMADPEYRAARVQEQRLQLYARREDAVRLLGFTAAEADGVIDLWATMNLEVQELRGPMNEAEAQQRREREAELERNLEQDLRKLLGDSRYAQWRDYMGSLPTRSTVSQLQSRLSGVESLRDDQIEPLVAALHPVAMQYDREMTDYLASAGPNEPGTIADDIAREEFRVELVATQNRRMHEAAAPVLSRRQLSIFDQQLQRALETQQAWLQMSRASMRDAAGKVAKAP